uniref:Beta/gamma crystallin 'Greek key' domain-containing protein n=1 Tax=Sinocyclocheilus anshuiensis TaxID=1608454 RepID=A0A671KHK9_9TELE
MSLSTPTLGFNNVISSLKVIGAPWVEGEYATLEDKGKFSSLKMITDDLGDPEIQLFEHVNYGGRSVTLHKETNLHDIAFSDIASSHKVKGGVWVLYEHVNRQETMTVTPISLKKISCTLTQSYNICVKTYCTVHVNLADVI